MSLKFKITVFALFWIVSCFNTNANVVFHFPQSLKAEYKKRTELNLNNVILHLFPNTKFHPNPSSIFSYQAYQKPDREVGGKHGLPINFVFWQKKQRAR